MAKGKNRGMRTEDAAEQKASSEKDTKENQPVNKDCNGKVQSVLRSVRSLSKPRSPLSTNSSTLIQDGNESAVVNPDSSKVKKDMPNEKCDGAESKQQKPEMVCHCHGVGEQDNDQLQKNKSTKHVTTKPAADGKVSASKPRSRTGCKNKAKMTANKVTQNRKVTDFYPIRRSNRKTKSEVKDEEHRHIDDVIKSGTEEGMEVKHIEGKGRGVFAVSGFKKGEFVVEYHGDLVELAEAKKREAQYAEDPQTGCYMYYFQYQSKTYCVDATKETSRLGRLINHSKCGNCQTRLHPTNGTPHLILVASRDIRAGEELLYDYGDRSKASVLAHPWLKH